jgi:hypothetical protein
MMVVITTRSVTVPRSLIVCVTATAIVVVVDRRVLVAGLTTFEVGVIHGRQLSQRYGCGGDLAAMVRAPAKARLAGVCSAHYVRDRGEP